MLNEILHTKRTPIFIGCALMVFYDLLDSHVVDIHIHTEKEIQDLERYERNSENEKDMETIHDDNKTEVEKIKAIERLIENNSLN